MAFDSDSRHADQADRLIADLRGSVLRSSEQLFSEFVGFLPKKLLDYSQKSGEDASVIGYSQARSLVLDQKPVLIKRFCRDIGYEFDDFLARLKTDRSGDDDIRESDMSLMDQDDVELDVALGLVRKRAETKYSRELWSLSQRFSVITGGDKISESELPISPGVFCQAMKHVVSGWSIPLNVKLVIVKLFEKSFFEGLEDFYGETNNHLVDQGVLPNLRYTVKRSETGSRHRADSLFTGEDEKAITELLKGFDKTGGRASGERVGYTGEQLLDATRNLQSIAASSIDDTVPLTDVRPVDIVLAKQQLLQTLQAASGAAETPVLSADDMRTIDLVGMLFQYMLDDEQLPDRVKAVLSHLHTPFIKVALANQEFFSHEEHPSRLLLNAMADAGVKWVGNDGKSQFGVIDTIRATVREVLDEFDKDTKLFAKLLVEFSSYIKKVEIKVQMLESRAAEKARGEDKLMQVKQRVNREIKSRVADIEVPSAILLLLLQPWQDYMAFVLLRYGEKSDHWRQAVNLVDDLIWGLQLEPTPENKAQWRQNYPWVESIILKGFETIGYDPGKAAKLKRAIDKVYEFSYGDQREVTSDELRDKLIRLVDRRVGESFDLESLAEQEREILQQLADVKFGTWFEHRDGRREKLAWYSRSSLKFLFVDQTGRRTGMREGSDLARSLIRGDIRMIRDDGQPLVDRALQTIYNEMTGHQKQMAPPGG
ncbi:MAG: DUF1631 family protein [bacterium]